MEYATVQGVAVPAIGVGTWQLSAAEAETSVERALELGYRHVDTAQAYGNERGVGRGLAAAGVDREEVFVTTKLAAKSREYDAVLKSVDASLSKLATAYLDLLLIHFPRPGVPLAETLSAMNELVDRGKVRRVGVSNFGVDRLHRARELSDAPVLTDQVLYHPFYPQGQLLDYCRIHDVLVTAYSPLAHGRAIEDPVLREIGERYGKSPAQVALRWLVQQENVATIPRSSSAAHLRENLTVFDFGLTDAEMERIHRPDRLGTVGRLLRKQLPV